MSEPCAKEGNRLPFERLVLVACTLIVLSGCTSLNEGATLPGAGDDVGPIEPQGVTGTPGAVGGAVSNSAPYVVSLTQSATTGDNRGSSSVILTGRVRDNNTEAQIQNVSVRVSGASSLVVDHPITAADRTATTEPASFGADGFKVWNAAPNDGVLDFRFRHTFPALAPVGDHVFRVHVADQPGASGASLPLTVAIAPFSDVTIAPAPVSAMGEALAGKNWGEWAAEAGARNVVASNYLKLVNTGEVASTRVVIDLASAFTGTPDANFTIPADGNVQFAWCEDTSPATTSPAECAFDFGAASPDASATVQFTQRASIVYVTYRIVALPEILPVQSYGISFTATEI